MIKQIHKISIVIALFVMVMTVFAGLPVNTAYAASDTANNFDNTAVTDDLAEQDLSKFTYDKNGTIKFITLAEYCYAANALDNENYALYLYIYNPARLEISERQGANTVEIATAYTDGMPADYENLPLKLCGIATGEHSKLLYKYRVIDTDGKLLGNARMQDNATKYRRYDIAGVQLWEVGKQNAVDYGVGGTYKFTGYAKGYGTDKNAESSLLCSVTELETISLDVRSTNYRTASSAAGKDHQNQLDSVYFSVDNSVLEKYGKLQKVKAEWYEYKTAPIVVISDKGIYDTLNGYIGKDIGEYTNELRYILGYDRNVISSPYSTIINYGWSYNVRCYSNVGITTTIVDSADKCGLLPYLFYTGGANIKDYNIPAETLKQWIYGYDKSAVKGYLPIKHGNISADLFLDSVDSGRTRGYNCVEIDASEKYDLLSYTANHGFWDKVCDYGFFATLFGKVPTDENVFGIEPIYAVQDKDFSYSDSGIAKNLLISENDLSDFKDYYNAAKKENKTTFLFRYAVTDYFAGSVDIDDGQSSSGLLIKDKAYMAKETVFMDFDIIQLTFNLDGVYTVIPVVANPIDIVGAITPPVEFEGSKWWVWVLIALAVILLLILLAPLLPTIITFLIKLIGWIFKGLWWLISAPFKLIAKAVKKRGSGGNG